MPKINYSEVKRLTEQGLGLRQIADHLSCHYTGVRYAQKKLGLSSLAKQNVKDQPPPFDPDKALELYAEGFGSTAIGNYFGVSHTAVIKFLKFKGIDVSLRANKSSGLSRVARRPPSKMFLASTKRQRFEEEQGICQECKSQIGDGTNYYLATYHHIQLVKDGGGREPTNCMVLHRECHEDPEIFYRLHGFQRGRLIRKSHKKLVTTI